MTTTKNCARCKVNLPVDDFGPSKRAKDGLYSYCRKCEAAKQAEMWASKTQEERDEKNRRRREVRKSRTAEKRESDARTQRGYYLLTKYGITLEEWESLFEAQGSVCGLCGSPDPRNKLGWHTDHCHETGKVRGITCYPCNVTMGHIEGGWRMPDEAKFMSWIRVQPA